MRRLDAVILAVCAAAVVGCDDASGSDEGPRGLVTAESFTPIAAYPQNGHPISGTTAAAEVLSRESELESLTNAHRVALGLPALVTRDDVRAVARAHSEHMIVHAFFDHVNPEGDQPWDRATRAGVHWLEYGENIAGGFHTATEAFQAFLQSSGHRANIEDPRWTAHGHGYAENPLGPFVRYWTQNFLRDTVADAAGH